MTSPHFTIIRFDNLASRCTTNASAINSLAARTSSLEAWRSAKAPASPDVPTNYSVPTSPISLGIQAPTASGINAIVNVIMGEVNGLKAILRAREILAT